MKAIVDPSLLSKELKKMNPVIGKNQILPVLECVKLDFNKKNLTITATNLNTWISDSIECANKEPFTLVAPIDKLLEICQKASGPIIITHSDKITIFDHDRGKVKIPVIATPNEFSNVENADYFNNQEVDGSFFHAITGANTCRLKDATRPHLSAVGIDFKKDKIVVIGTDGHAMHKHDFKSKIDKPCVISVGQIFCDLVKNFQTAKLSISDKFIKVEHGTTIVISRLSETRYVDYSPAFKGSERPYNIRVDRKELLSRLDVVDIASSWSLGDILFTLSPGNIHMFAQDKDMGNEADTDLLAEHELSGQVRLKSDTLKQVLGTVTEDVILMSIDDPTKNIYIQPEDNKDITLSIMPLMLNN